MFPAVRGSGPLNAFAELKRAIDSKVPPAVKETIATRVIREASSGERDMERLLLAGLKGISI